MKAEYWQSKWNKEEIGFHQSRVNTRLEQYWPKLGLDSSAPVFVPLCGKSIDMLHLHKLGHPVVGVELSNIAVNAFFNENGIAFETQNHGNLQEFTGSEDAAGIRLFAGDMFELETAQTGALSGFYDRAALIAMPPEMRARYVQKLAQLLSPGATGLLISLIYDPSKMSGPPFSVSDDAVRELMSDYFDINVLAHSSGSERLGNLAKRGLSTMEEYVYQLTRKSD